VTDTVGPISRPLKAPLKPEIVWTLFRKTGFLRDLLLLGADVVDGVTRLLTDCA
jgi:hypothetical protein